MPIDYKCCKMKGTSEVVEKKSRFLGEMVPCKTQEEAEQYIAAVRKTHYDARHHCFAYICGTPGTASELLRQSDDGEPQGTAGKPLLEILSGNDLHETLLIVTRYFGGTLLGTGGLVRAYSEAGVEAMKAAEITTIRQGIRLLVGCSYTLYGKLQYLFANEGWRIEDTAFESDVAITLTVPADEAERAFKLITEATSAAASVENLGNCTFEE